MTDTQDLIASLQNMVDENWASAAECESLKALEATQAEIERLTKRLNEPVPLSEWQKMEAELTAALARLAEIEAGASPVQPNSCAYCTHPLFVGLKCKHCGRVVQPSQAALSNPNNCQYCDHSKTPQGGHCYMFREAPTEICHKHTLAGVSAAINAKGAAS